jgi:hypothetical protein
LRGAKLNKLYLTVNKNNIPRKQHRARFDFFGCRKQFGDEHIRAGEPGLCNFKTRAQLLKENVLFIERFIGKKHLRGKPVLFAAHVEMNVRRALLGRANRIRARLDGFETKTPLGV